MNDKVLYCIENFSVYSTTSRDTVVSRAKYREATARHSGYLYASRPVESNRDYQTSITTERIEFLLSLIDSLGLNYIRKVSLFLLYILYKQRYYDAKSRCGNFRLRNVTVTVTVTVVIATRILHVHNTYIDI